MNGSDAVLHCPSVISMLCGRPEESWAEKKRRSEREKGKKREEGKRTGLVVLE
jgi:hypothetical protein